MLEIAIILFGAAIFAAGLAIIAVVTGGSTDE